MVNMVARAYNKGVKWLHRMLKMIRSGLGVPMRVISLNDGGDDHPPGKGMQ